MRPNHATCGQCRVASFPDLVGIRKHKFKDSQGRLYSIWLHDDCYTYWFQRKMKLKGHVEV